MNNSDRMSFAGSVALVFCLLLVYGLVGQLDHASEHANVETHNAGPCRLLCEAVSTQADPPATDPGLLRLVDQDPPQSPSHVVLHCQHLAP